MGGREEKRKRLRGLSEYSPTYRSSLNNHRRGWRSAVGPPIHAVLRGLSRISGCPLATREAVQ